jgi:tetratricopeptide (TPR) repeat protein/transcriptional regulator with XRE-family HTH domain
MHPSAVAAPPALPQTGEMRWDRMTGHVDGFGDLVRRHRAAAELTQLELAERTGMSVRAISDIERGRTSRPHPNSVLLLARALGVPERALTDLILAGEQDHDGAGDAAAPGLEDRRAETGLACGAGERAVPRQLPGGVAHFVGRAAELKALTDLLRYATAAPGTVVISAIAGTAGIGKTALALHWAHLVAGKFPDGQLYVDLRGYDPSGRPLTPAAAIRGFLDALSVPPDRVPASAAAQAGLYRSLVEGRRMLIVLDNARDAEQVRPLLPASPGCLVLVTSRNLLTDLVTQQGAYPLTLDVLAEAEAHDLLSQRLGAERLAAERDAARQLIDLCARLPLALSIIAARAATHPHFPLASLAGELHDARTRLDALDWGERTSSIRAVFSWSCEQLSAPAARVFQLLGLHPGPDITVWATASLAGFRLHQAREALAELHHVNLLTEPVPGRFAFHDLLRAYTAELAASLDRKQEQDAALSRLVNYYLRAAVAAMDMLFPVEQDRRPSIAPSAAAEPALDDRGAARAFLDAERANLVAVAVHAADRHLSRQAIQIAATLSRYLQASGHYAEAVTLHSRTSNAARDTGDHSAEAAELTSLGNAEFLQGHYDEAAGYLKQALALSRRAGDRAAEARALNSIGMGDYNLCHYERAARHFRQTAALCREVGERHGLAITLSNIGLVELRLGRCQLAARHLRQALEVSDQGDHVTSAGPDILGRAVALSALGQVELRAGRPRQASDYLRQALACLRQTRYPLGEVDALDYLGRAELALGRHQQAAGLLHQALAIVRETGLGSAEGPAVNSLGQVLLASGDPGKARTEHERALALARRSGDRYEQARAHDGLGHACQAAGDHREAREQWRQALAIYAAIGVPEADTVRVRLTAAADAPQIAVPRQDGAGCRARSAADGRAGVAPGARPAR